MRTAFINTLCQLAEKDKKIFLLTGDLGFSILERFRDRFPNRFINAGVAEANMIGVAAGLALSGKIIFVYSIVPFLTMRCFEQVRNDLCQQRVNVKLVGIGGGLSYGAAGPTHHSIEDIAIMRALPNMVVLCPGDPVETELSIKSVVLYQGPAYIRLGKSNEPEVHFNTPNFKIGRGITIKNGSDITIIATGNMLYTAREVTNGLEKNGFSIRLISMHTIKPLDKNIIMRAAQETKAIFTIEEHNIIGGLGSAAAEVLGESNYKILFRRIGLFDQYLRAVGSQMYLRKKSGLSVERIVSNILTLFKR